MLRSKEISGTSLAAALLLPIVFAVFLIGCSSESETAPGSMPDVTIPATDLVQNWDGIPLLDLSDDAARQVVVDREPGQYLGHPTTHLLPDGSTILVVYPKGHGAGEIVMKRSSDRGLTWSDRLPVSESWSTSKEVPTLYGVRRSGGDERLLLFSGLYPIRLSISEDRGETWSELAPIGDFGGIVAMASLIRRRDDGFLTAFFHDDGRFLTGSGIEEGPFTVYATDSPDEGGTWSPPRIVVADDSLDLCEPGVIRSPDGRQLAALLRENSRTAPSQLILSDDEGRSWSAIRPLPAGLTGDRHVGVYVPGGRLVISFRDMAAGSPTKGDWMVWVGTYADLLGGQSAGYRVRLMDNHDEWDSTYPALEVLADGSVVATTYGHWTEGEEPYVVSVRFTVAELDVLVGPIRDGA